MKEKFSLLLPGLMLLAGTTVSLSACATSTEVTSEQTAVVLCHRERRTLTVSDDEVGRHLDHGDTVGACE